MAKKIDGLAWAFSLAASLYALPALADGRVQTVAYQPDRIVKLPGQFGYQTAIELSAEESVQTASVGDAEAWIVNAAKNFVFVKPKIFSHTNLSVLTNLRHYQFELATPKEVKTPLFKLRFVYPTLKTQEKPSIETLKATRPKQLNWRYSFTGDKGQAPIETFDDGQFTYFKFRKDGAALLPAIFSANAEREESLVNYHQEGDYLVLHWVAKQFTLRQGNVVTTVYNDSLIEGA